MGNFALLAVACDYVEHIAHLLIQSNLDIDVSFRVTKWKLVAGCWSSSESKTGSLLVGQTPCRLGELILPYYKSMLKKLLLAQWEMSVENGKEIPAAEWNSMVRTGSAWRGSGLLGGEIREIILELGTV